MLDLINRSRRSAGVAEVVLDPNPTAQLHAEDCRRNCSSGHWGSDGLKPYMRYTLSGGIDSCSENVSGSSYCPPDVQSYSRRTLAESVTDAHEGLMRSPGHRRNILDHAHRRVGIGIAYARPNCWVVQLFTSDYIEYWELPNIVGGTLKFAYGLKNGAVQPGDPPTAFLYYDPPPRRLTRGQLARASSYDSGLLVAGFRPPAPFMTSWSNDSFTTETSTNPDPYAIPHDARPPVSFEDSSRLNIHAKTLAEQRRPETLVVPWITVRLGRSARGIVQAQADISRILRTYGAGVYSLAIDADVGGGRTRVSHYSMWVN